MHRGGGLTVQARALLAPAVAAERTQTAPGQDVQGQWASVGVASRLRVLGRARHLLAARSDALCAAISPELARTHADTLVAEVLPLLAACHFLERNAARVLRTRRLGRAGLPFWLAGVRSRVERVPFGSVLVIAPANYPLLLPGVQVLQALAAGNSVVWKPGRGGRAVALLVAQALTEAKLPDGLLRVTGEGVAEAEAELKQGPDKIVFTGSGEAGEAVLHAAARTRTPVTAELAGADAVVVLPTADAARVVDALAFGLRLNGSATCMAPRRLVLVGDGHGELLQQLRTRLRAMPAVEVGEASRARLASLLTDAAGRGAFVEGDATHSAIAPILVTGADPTFALAQADVFAPVLTILELPNLGDLPTLDRQCPFGLTLAFFGDEATCLQAARGLAVGTVLVNDLIVPTADPRVPFGGRRASGFGTTRGAEGLLEMSAPRSVLVRRGRSTRHFAPTSPAHAELFSGIIAMSHSATLAGRLAGARRMLAAGAKLQKPATNLSGRDA